MSYRKPVFLLFLTFFFAILIAFANCFNIWKSNSTVFHGFPYDKIPIGDCVWIPSGGLEILLFIIALAAIVIYVYSRALKGEKK